MSDPAPGPATFPAAIAARLRREILTGALPPGSPVKERDHAERLGVSRTPLREAVRILAKEGLVTLRPLRSPLVADPTRDEALDEVADGDAPDADRALRLVGVAARFLTLIGALEAARAIRRRAAAAETARATGGAASRAL